MIASTGSSFRRWVWAGLVILALSPAVRAGTWWRSRWPYRAQIKLTKHIETDLPGDDVALAVLRTPELGKKDAGDLRIVSARDNQAVPFRVLRVGPGDLLTVLFAIRKGHDEYAAYWGNPKADTADVQEEIDKARRALASARSLEDQAKRAVASADKARDAGQKKVDAQRKAVAEAQSAHRKAERTAKALADRVDRLAKNAKTPAASQPTTGPADLERKLTAQQLADAKKRQADAKKQADAARRAVGEAQKALADLQKSLADAITRRLAAVKAHAAAKAKTIRARTELTRWERLAQPLDIRRGVLLEMWPHVGGDANNLRQARQTLARARKSRPIIGRAMLDQVFTGFSPFGDHRKICAEYVGYFKVAKEGPYGFGTSSRNASFVEVDGREVVRNGGWHGPRRRIRATGTVNLKPGLHCLRVIHVSPWSDPMLSLVWRPPGEKWTLMPQGAFAPVTKTKVEPIERAGRSAGVDFLVEHLGEAFMMERYYQRMGFRTGTTGQLTGRNYDYAWDFGDGQSATTAEPRVEHVYLTPGEYRVTVRLTGHTSPLEMTHRIRVDRDWRNVERRRIDGVKSYAKRVRAYDLAKLSPRHNTEAVLLFQRAGDADAMRKACEALLARKQAGAYELRTVLPIYRDALIAGGKTDAAVRVLTKAAMMTTDAAVRAEMLEMAARVLLESADDPAGAQKVFEKVIAECAKADTPAVRASRIGLGDVQRALGDFDKAWEAYRQAGITDKRAASFPRIVKGDFARQVADYLRRKDYAAARDALDEWETVMPTSRVEGYSTTFRVELLLAEKKYAEAAKLAAMVARCNSKSFYAPKLLLQEAIAEIKLKHKAPAVRALRRIVKDYPETPEAIEAKKLLTAAE